VSGEEPLGIRIADFQDFMDFLQQTYPFVHALPERRTFGQFSLLFKWEGTDADLLPVLLMAHYDVVPVEVTTESLWKYEPFSGHMTADSVWGRGAMDDKLACIALMEAVEQLLREGQHPQRTVYLALGHDEEKGGYQGAQQIATYLQEHQITCQYILDEGGAITDGIIPGAGSPVALIGIAEKGILNLELSVNIAGGHASMPAGATAIEVLARAIDRLKSHPFPTQITEPTRLMFDHLGPELPWPLRIAFANADILQPLLMQKLNDTPQGNASIRTTMVPTIISAGLKENVIPQTAKAVINLRTLPGATTHGIIDRLGKVIQDERILIEPVGVSADPSTVSDVSAAGYRFIEQSIREIYPETIVVPNLLVGATDSRHFAGVSEHIYRFRPFHLDPETVQSVHGINERVAKTDLENGIRFFSQLIRNSAFGPQ
jgi:carboxypeptidase PM20D1